MAQRKTTRARARATTIRRTPGKRNLRAPTPSVAPPTGAIASKRREAALPPVATVRRKPATVATKKARQAVHAKVKKGFLKTRVNVPRGRPVKKAREVLITSFHAHGEIGDGYSYAGGRRTRAARTRYFKKAVSTPKGLVEGPGAFHSNEGLFLGQVNFEGYVPLETLQKLLNQSLQLRDRKGDLKDYRDVYKNWSWKYQVFRKRYPAGARSKPTREIVQRKRGHSK